MLCSAPRRKRPEFEPLATNFLAGDRENAVAIAGFSNVG